MYLNSKKLFIARAIAECLAAGFLVNTPIHADLLTEILIHAAGLDRNSISTADITSCFKGDEGDDYVIRYDCVELDLDLSQFPCLGSSDVLRVQRQRRDRDNGSNKRYLVVGRFDSEDAAKADWRNEDIATEMRFTKANRLPLSDVTKERLVEKIENKRVYSKATKKKAVGKKRSNDRREDADAEQARKRSKETHDAPQLISEKDKLQSKYDAALADYNEALSRYNEAKSLLRDKHDELGSSMAALAIHEALSAPPQREAATNLPQDEMEIDNIVTEQSASDITPNTRQSAPTATGNVAEVPSTNTNDGGTLFYTYNGIAGCMTIGDNDTLTVADLQQNTKTEETKVEGYTLLLYGKKLAWVPNRAELIGKNVTTKLNAKAQKIDKLINLFSTSRCILPPDSLHLISAGCMRVYGAGDDAKSFLIMCTVRAIFKAIGLDDISCKQISKSLPKKTTLAEIELRLAALVRVAIRQEQRDDNVDRVGRQSDHGKRKGFDHNIMIDSWVKEDEHGVLQLKTHVVGTSHTGGTAEETASGMKKDLHVFYELTRLVEEVENAVRCVSSSSDTGGGAGIQILVPVMKRLGIMDANGVYGNCLLHAMNKPMENALIHAYGTTGIGHNTLWQALHLFKSIFKRALAENDADYLDKMWAAVMEKILDQESDYRKLAEQYMPQLLNYLLNVIKDLETQISQLTEEGEDEEAKRVQNELSKLKNKYPRNVSDPVFSRWQTTDACSQPFLVFYVSIYFFAVAIVKSHKAKAYIVTLSKTLLSLMHARSTPQLNQVAEDDEEVEISDDAIERDVNELLTQPVTIDVDNLTDGLVPGQSPTIAVILIFFRCFCDRYQTDNFNFLMQKDPALGERSFGYLARFVMERLAVMDKQISEMENGGYKSLPEFKPFMDSLQGVHSGSIQDAGLDYFEKAPEIFFQRLRKDFEKHMVQYWLRADNGTKIFYALGGDKEIARATALWLVHHHEQTGVVVDEDEYVTPYQFEDRDITLGSFHDNRRGSIKLNLKESMDFITKGADPTAILANEFVKENWNQIVLMANADNPIDLFDLSTWGDLDLKAFRRAFACHVCIHPTHQQLSESYVQAINMVSLSGVGQRRRGHRIDFVSGVLRRMTESAMGETSTNRLRGAEYGCHLLEFMEQFLIDAKRAVDQLGEEKFRQLVHHMKTADKQKDDECAEKFTRFERGLEKDYSIPAAENSVKIDITARVGGKMTLSLLTQKADKSLNGIITMAVHAELSKRQIDISEDELENLPLKKKVEKIRFHEFKEVRAQREGFSKEQDIKAVTPLSDELKDFMVNHQETLLQQKGK